MSALSCTGLDVEVGERRLVEGLHLDVHPGEFVALLGENGVGKTLTLHTLAGLRAPARGEVWLFGRRLGEWPRRARAQQLALLAQATEDPFPSTVLETALIGRHPHIGFWRWEESEDIRLTRAALAAVDLAERERREVQTLSGGERRRLAIAATLTQDAPLCLLDEPTNHLDPHHQVEVLRLFQVRARAGCAVIASLHDPTLAARFADRSLLLFGNGRWLYGPSAEILTAHTLTELYHTPIEEIAYRDRRVFVGA